MLGLFGVVVTSESSDSFLAFPDRKSSLTKDFQDQNGILIDLSKPRFSAREFVLKCGLVAESREDYFNKYNGLFTELSGRDSHRIYIRDHDQTYSVYYKSQRSIKKITQINRDKIGVSFELVFGEANPMDNLKPVYLVDDKGRYLIA